MKKHSKSKPSVLRVDPYLEGLMGKLLDRLSSLEKKIDAVLSKISGNNVVKPMASEPKPPRQERQLYEAICAACSKVCEVPFRPTENRPVYCKECWAKKKQSPNAHSVIPILRPVALPPKPQGKLGLPAAAPSSLPAKPKKSKKTAPAKKAKKKK